MKTMTISNVAKKAGVGVETVRYYERKGLVDQPAKPSSGGFRVYPAEAAEQIRLIREAQERRLADCCGQGINEETLKAAGLGQPLGN